MSYQNVFVLSNTFSFTIFAVDPSLIAIQVYHFSNVTVVNVYHGPHEVGKQSTEIHFKDMCMTAI